MIRGAPITRTELHSSAARIRRFSRALRDRCLVPGRDWGRFPFGRPNSRCLMRVPERGLPEVLVVGVYPSAFHVAWSPPLALDRRAPEARRRPLISSLAVDVEPTVFWNGIRPSPADVFDAWMAASEFDHGAHGMVRPGVNGPSGAGLIAEFLGPLRVDAARCAFTDAVPWFFVKSDAKGQGAAIRDRFAPVAEVLGVHVGSLPPRPTRRNLVAIAAGDERRDSLRDELSEAQAPLVITLRAGSARCGIRGGRCQGSAFQVLAGRLRQDRSTQGRQANHGSPRVGPSRLHPADHKTRRGDRHSTAGEANCPSPGREPISGAPDRTGRGAAAELVEAPSLPRRGAVGTAAVLVTFPPAGREIDDEKDDGGDRHGNRAVHPAAAELCADLLRLVVSGRDERLKAWDRATGTAESTERLDWPHEHRPREYERKHRTVTERGLHTGRNVRACGLSICMSSRSARRALTA